MLYSASFGPGNGVGLGVGDGGIVAVLVTVGEGIAVGVSAATFAVVTGSVVAESTSATLSICWDPEHAVRTREISKTNSKVIAVLYAIRGTLSIRGSFRSKIWVLNSLSRELFSKSVESKMNGTS
jgi:hypothetical protein